MRAGSCSRYRYAGVGRSPEKIADTTREIIQEALEFLPGGRILLQSVMPREAIFKAAIEELNARLARIAAEEGVAFLNLYDPTGGRGT